MAWLSVDDLVQQAVGEAAAEINRRQDLPHVHDAQYRVGPDSARENTIWIWLVLDDPVPPGTYPRAVQSAVRETVLRRLHQIPCTQFALDATIHVFLQRKSEVEAAQSWRNAPGT